MASERRASGREERLRRARRRGAADGIASVFCVAGPRRPLRTRVRRDSGSLFDDVTELQRDGERLVHGCS